MCLGALCWARPARIFFAATRDDAAAAGFDDALIYREILTPPEERAIPTIHLSHPRAARPFEEWRAKPDKTRY
jgi:guanine deaminase